MFKNLIIAVFSTAVPGIAFAIPCESAVDDSLNGMAWRSVQSSEYGYTICYDGAHQQDIAVAERWMKYTYDTGRTKYRITLPIERRGEELHILFFLVPSPTAYASSSRSTNFTGQRRGIGELHMLTPSSPHFSRSGYVDQTNYFIAVLVHEMMNLIDSDLDGRSGCIDTPEWIKEGLAQFEGYKAIEEQEHRFDWFREYVDSTRRREIVLGRTLADPEGTGPSIMATDRYYASTAILIFMAEKFGEDVHRRFYCRPVSEVLNDEGIGDQTELFNELGEWLKQETAEPPGGGGGSYTPSVACTGRFWFTNDGISFEVLILNNDARPPDHVGFQQQYRPEASRPWTKKSTLSVFSGNASGFSNPLFTSVSSPPFQWRARSCPYRPRTDEACSNWSNVIDWTAASCASTRVGRAGFTDHPLRPGSTPIRTIHFRELQQRIGALRTSEGLPAVQWTDPTLTAGVTLVKRVHLTELREALDAVYDAVGQTRPSYTDPEVTAQATAVKAAHLMELREAVAALE